MITYIKINGFKSFYNFEMEFKPFTVVAGANASGKSNLFDALKLLKRLAETDNLKKAFKEQRGEITELFTQYSENNYATEMEFCVEMLVNKKVKDAWGNEKELKYTRLRYELKIERFTNTMGIQDLKITYEHLEKLKHMKDKWIKLIPKKMREHWRPKVGTGKRGIPYIKTEKENDILTVLVPQDGVRGGNKRRFPLTNATRTVLSSFDTIDFPHVLAAKEEMRSWKFLQLNPTDLRQPTNKSMGEDIISESGKNLAAALYRIQQEDEYNLREIARRLQTFITHFTRVEVIDDKENNQFLIQLKDRDKKKYSSRVLSEGTLRVLALAILESDNTYNNLLCFEEPENGIHPLRIKDMATLLKDLSNDFINEYMPLRQVIINTHSPVLVGTILQKYINDKHVGVYFASMPMLITTINEERVGFKISTLTKPLEGYDASKNIGGLFKDISVDETKYALYKIKEYLETLRVETILDNLDKKQN